MKQPEKSTDPRRKLRLKAKKKNNTSSKIRKDTTSPQKAREENEPEAEQARLRKAKK